MPERVGFIGLGIMGGPMARNLMRAGYELTIHNRSQSKAEELAAEGAEPAESPREVVQGSDIVITMLPGPPEVREVIAGEGGVLERSSEGSLIVDMSTSSPSLARELAATARDKKVGMLDAPVSGRDVGTIAGTLSIMVGGAEEDFERAKPLFKMMGETVIHVGRRGVRSRAFASRTSYSKRALMRSSLARLICFAASLSEVSASPAETAPAICRCSSSASEALPGIAKVVRPNLRTACST